MSEGNKKRVLVLGAGFGGLEFCKTFQHEDAEIILVDRQNHHLFQPLLYQVATAGLSQPEIAQPIRSIFTNRKDITVLMDEAPRDFSFAWDRPGVAGQTSHWSFSAADSDSEITVINANLIRQNPFYLVPLYHAIRVRDLSMPLRDFRVRCSIPCYVEMIDAATDRVIAVDRRGDGSFREPGDIVYQDENHDLYPDHRFTEAGEVFGLELRVFPADEVKGAEITEAYTIAIEGLVNGTWKVLAENRVERTKAK